MLLPPPPLPPSPPLPTLCPSPRGLQPPHQRSRHASRRGLGGAAAPRWPAGGSSGRPHRQACRWPTLLPPPAPCALRLDKRHARDGGDGSAAEVRNAPPSVFTIPPRRGSLLAGGLSSLCPASSRVATALGAWAGGWGWLRGSPRRLRRSSPAAVPLVRWGGEADKADVCWRRAVHEQPPTAPGRAGDGNTSRR